MLQKLVRSMLVLVIVSAFWPIMGSTQAQSADDACYAIIQTQPSQQVLPDSIVALPSGDGIDVGFTNPLNTTDSAFAFPIMLGDEMNNPQLILSTNSSQSTNIPLVGVDMPIVGVDVPVVSFDVALIGQGTSTQAWGVPFDTVDIPIADLTGLLVSFDDINGNNASVGTVRDEMRYYVPLLVIGDRLDDFDEPILFLETFDEPILFHINNRAAFVPDPDVFWYPQSDKLITFDEPILFVESGEILTQVMAVYPDIVNNQNWALLPNGRWLPMSMLTVADGCNPPILDGTDLQALGLEDWQAAGFGTCQVILEDSVATFSTPTSEANGIWGTVGTSLSMGERFTPLQAHYVSRNGGYSYLLLGNDIWVRTQDVKVVGDCLNLPRLTDAESMMVCEVQLGSDQVAIRVGPSENRAVFTTLANTVLGVIGQYQAERGSVWWQVAKSDVPGGASANTLWVADADVETIGNCENVADAEAPPVIQSQPTVEDIPDTTTPNPEDNGDDPPPVDQPLVCYSLALSANFGAAGSVSASPSPNCDGGKYTAGTVVTITATPNAGATFSGWTGTCGASGNPASVTMNSDCSAVAQFVIN